MRPKVVAGIGLVVLLGGMALLLRSSRAREREHAVHVEERAREQERVARDLVAADGGSQAREALEEDAAPAPAAAEDEAARLSLRGRVLTLGGVPLEGVGVALAEAPGDEPAEAAAAARADGSFALEGEPFVGTRYLVVADGRYATLLAGVVRSADPGREHVVLAARAIEVGGRVQDESGVPVAGVEVSARPDENFRESFRAAPLEGTRRRRLTTVTDSLGRFRLARVPAPSAPFPSSLVFVHHDHHPAHEPLPRESDLDLVVELRALGEGGPYVEGVVLEPEGAPAPGAHVRHGEHWTLTDGEGWFRLPLGDEVHDASVLAATLAGFRPALEPEFGRLVAEAAPHPPDPLRLVLGPEPLEIAGRVIDADGAPHPGWHVFLREGTELSHLRLPPILVEPASTVFGTDVDGFFRIGGLLARDYVLRAYDPDSLLMIESAPIPAGTDDALLRVPRDAFHARVSGRVVSRRTGAPVPGAEVAPRLVTRRTDWGTTFDDGRAARTDASGRFELREVPRARVHLVVKGERVIPSDHELPPTGPVDDLLLEVARRCRFRAVLEGPVPSDGTLAIEVHDAEGRRLPLTQFRGRSSSTGTQVRLRDGEFPPCATSEDAATLVLVSRTDASRELLRQALQLDPERELEILLAP